MERETQLLWSLKQAMRDQRGRAAIWEDEEEELQDRYMEKWVWEAEIEKTGGGEERRER